MTKFTPSLASPDEARMAIAPPFENPTTVMALAGGPAGRDPHQSPATGEVG